MVAVGLLRGRVPLLCACLAVLGLALSGCSTNAKPATSSATIVGSTLDVWASQPPGPADAVAGDVLDGERLALRQAGGKAGAYTVTLRVAHDREISANARDAVQDKKAIAYLGETGPGTSGVSLQITNQVGLLQVSPTDSAVYLTQSTPAVADSPDHYYPAKGTYHRTFARMVPTSAAEAKALVSDMRTLKISKLLVSSDGTSYGASMADEVRSDARAAGITIATSPADADGAFVAAVKGRAATGLLDQLAAKRPGVKLFASSSLADDSFVSGLSSAAQSSLYASVPGVAPGSRPPAATAFAAAFTSAYGHAPAPQAVYGYEAMSALVAVLKDLGSQAASRSQVVARFRGLKNRSSALGTYSLSGGDISLASFLLGHAAGGKLVFRSAP